MMTILDHKVSSFRQLLSKGFGVDVAGGDAYDGWLSFFRTATAKTFADLSFDEFRMLSSVKAHGPFAVEVNGALNAAKSAIEKPTAIGTPINSELKLDRGDDTWRGGSENNKVHAGGGNDVVVAGAGNDTVNGGRGNDLIFGGEGNDSVIGGAGNDTVFGGDGRDIIRGWSGDDFIFGGSGNDGLYGAEGNDTIFGGDGNDYICAGSDHDMVYGGRGRDTFAFRGDPPNSVTVIKDFEVMYDRQGIKSSVAGGHLSVDMIKPYQNGLMIDFGQGRALCYEGVWDATALFSSMYLLEA
jgi:Ca2+-binding RTX toxin-like protein